MCTHVFLVLILFLYGSIMLNPMGCVCINKAVVIRSEFVIVGDNVLHLTIM